MRTILASIVVFISLSTYAQDQMFDICPLKVGEKIPENVSVTSSTGESVKFNEILSKKSIVVFYRGGWCPYCIRHLSALHEIKKDIEELGYDLIAITPDRFDSLGVSAAKAESDFTIYSDSDISLINAFGLGWKVDDEKYMKYKESYKLDLEEWSDSEHHILPVPAVYIVNDGLIEYNYVNPNYSKRLKPETLMAILNSFVE